MTNMLITCIQCEADFEFSAQDQEKFQRMGFDLPKRCPQCRKHKVSDANLYEKRKFKSKKRHFRMKYESDYVSNKE